MNALEGAALALSVGTALASRIGGLKVHHGQGLMAIANTLMSVDLAHIAATSDEALVRGVCGVIAVLVAVNAAVYAWAWWTGGGGDDTKRRLRRWRRAFAPVRRTAPASS